MMPTPGAACGDPREGSPWGTGKGPRPRDSGALYLFHAAKDSPFWGGGARAPQRHCPEAALWGPKPAAQRPLGAAQSSTEHPLPCTSRRFQWKAPPWPEDGPPAFKAFASRDTGLFAGGPWGRGEGAGNPTHLFVLSSSPTLGQDENNNRRKRFLADRIWNLIAWTAAAAAAAAWLAPSLGARHLPARAWTLCKPSTNLIGGRCPPLPSPRPVPAMPSSEAAAHRSTGGSNTIYYNKQGGPLTNRPA